jgi:hypothetical protein
MKRSKLGMTLLLSMTVLAFGAVTASSASAACQEFIVSVGEFKNVSLSEAECLATPQVQNTNATVGQKFWLLVTATKAAEWLLNGAAITSELPATTSEELLLEETSLKVDILCSISFGGSVGPGNKDLITLAEDLEGHDVTSISTQKWVDCSLSSKGMCEEANGTLTEVFPLNLPWETKFELITYETGLEEFVDLITNAGKNPGFLMECKILGIKGDASCTGETKTRLENGVSDVLNNFTEEEVEAVECTTPLGKGTGTLVSTGGLTESSEGTLQVS